MTYSNSHSFVYFSFHVFNYVCILFFPQISIFSYSFIYYSYHAVWALPLFSIFIIHVLLLRPLVLIVSLIHILFIFLHVISISYRFFYLSVIYIIYFLSIPLLFISNCFWLFCYSFIRYLLYLSLFLYLFFISYCLFTYIYSSCFLWSAFPSQRS